MHRIEKTASAVMGAAKVAQATLEGVSGVFQQLMREHGEVTALMMRIELSSEMDVRRELFPKIREELLSHEQAELIEVYPVFAKHVELVVFVEEHESDAGTLERHLQRLSALAYEDPDWAPAFTDLMNAVSHHVRDEEGEYFPAASKILGTKFTQAMTARYQARKEAVMKVRRH